MPESVGLPIDQTELPEWVRRYLSDEQLQSCTPLLIWVIVASESSSLGSTEKHLVKELYMRMHTLRKSTRTEWNTALVTLERRTGISENTLTKAVKTLQNQGWISVSKKRRSNNTYAPTWPSRDCTATAPEKQACGVWIPKKEKTCGRPPGYGTATSGRGPCVFHGGTENHSDSQIEPPDVRPNSAAKPTVGPRHVRPNSAAGSLVGPQDVRFNEGPEPDSTAGSAEFDRSSCGIEPQALRFNKETEPGSTAAPAEFDRNSCGIEPQDVRVLTAAPEDQYDQSRTSEFDQEGIRGSLTPGAEVEVPPRPSPTVGATAADDRPARYGPVRTRLGDAARVADDNRGRRWLVETFLLGEGQADEVIVIVREIDPNIRNLARYLEAMHRDEHGAPKPDLLDIVEAVQIAGRRAAERQADAWEEAAEPETEPEFTPPRIFASPTGCRHDSPNADRTGCTVCGINDAHAPTPPPAAPGPALVDLPAPCNHGVPGGYLPADGPDPAHEVWPSCIRCQSHVIAAQCRKKTDPCPHCNTMRAAAGLPPLSPDLVRETA